MPVYETITALFTFQPITKARAVQLNTNFSNLRGHLMPTDPTLVRSVDRTYNLGSNEYRWREAYVDTVNVSASFGSDHFLHGATGDAFAFGEHAYDGDFVDNTNSVSIIGDRVLGYNCTSLESTISAGLGQIAVWADETSGADFIPDFVTGSVNQTCTLETLGRNVLIGLKNLFRVEDPGNEVNEPSGISVYAMTSTASTFGPVFVNFLEDGTTIASYQLRAPKGLDFYPIGYFECIRYASPGTHVYTIEERDSTTTAAAAIQVLMERCVLFAVEF